MTSDSTLISALLNAPVERPFVTMYRDGDDIETVTFGQFTHRVRCQATRLAAEGVSAGDRVILIMPQDIPLMVSFAATMLIGAIPAILAYPNFKIEPSKYRHGLAGVSRNLNARFVVLDEAFPDDLRSHVALENTRVLHAVEHVEAAPEHVGPRSSPQDIAFIQHSAGTTGLQKGVALTHAAVLTQLRHLTGALQLRQDDRIYSWLPLYHDMGLIACFMLPMAFHVPVVMQSPTDWVMQPAMMPFLISKYRCTLAWAPNFTYQFLARRVRPEDKAGFDLSSLRMLINCSEPVRAQSTDEFVAAYAACGLKPGVVQASYAMAENVFAVTQSGGAYGSGPARFRMKLQALTDRQVAEPAEDGVRAVDVVSSGRCLPNNRVRIVGADGAELPDGHVGEIHIQSDSLFNGYYNRPDLTEKALKDGWYMSGDLGFVRDGELYVIGRKDDLIIVAGKNIYPGDIEEIVGGDLRIRDGRVVAFGLFNPDIGTEEIVVVAEVRDINDLKHASAIEQAARNAVVAELGVAVRALYLKEPAWIVKEYGRKTRTVDDARKALTGAARTGVGQDIVKQAEQAQAIIDYLISSIIRRPGIVLTSDTSLVASGMIDSFALVDILFKVEDVTGMRISAGKVQPKDLDTVNLMLATASRVGTPRSPK